MSKLDTLIHRATSKSMSLGFDPKLDAAQVASVARAYAKYEIDKFIDKCDKHELNLYCGWRTDPESRITAAQRTEIKQRVGYEHT